MNNTEEIKLLVDESTAIEALSVSREDFDWLVATRQINPITIRNRRLVRVPELHALIAAYTAVQYRD